MTLIKNQTAAKGLIAFLFMIKPDHIYSFCDLLDDSLQLDSSAVSGSVVSELVVMSRWPVRYGGRDNHDSRGSDRCCRRVTAVTHGPAFPPLHASPACPCVASLRLTCVTSLLRTSFKLRCRPTCPRLGHSPMPRQPRQTDTTQVQCATERSWSIQNYLIRAGATKG